MPRTRPGDMHEQHALNAPDLMVVVAYGLLLPPAMLDAPRRGCLNIHASLLPRWRGAAPIHRAIEAGDAKGARQAMEQDLIYFARFLLNLLALEQGEV